jgi:hypothetical protein
VIAVDEIGQPRRTAGGGNDGIQVVLVHRGVNSLLSEQPVVLFPRVEVFLARERPLGLGLDEQFLAKVGHFLVAMLLIELDNFGE